MKTEEAYEYQGWSMPNTSRRFHYFRKNDLVSLCHEAGLIGNSFELKNGEPRIEGCCKTCLKKKQIRDKKDDTK